MDPQDTLRAEVAQHFRDETRKAQRAAKPKRTFGPGHYDEKDYSEIESESFGLTEYLQELNEIQQEQRERGINPITHRNHNPDRRRNNKGK